MSESHAPVLVRMEIELKAALQRQATLHGRTLTGEINLRLRESLTDQPAPGIAPAPTHGKALPPSYLEAHHVTVSTIERPGHTDNGPAPALTDLDRAMLRVFHAMPVEKQLGLLSLFK